MQERSIIELANLQEWRGADCQLSEDHLIAVRSTVNYQRATVT